ncbi:hypothetical protein N7520_005224 [Penicillium odoratum]|uniref:uncharacterized protein n=1 Tax=Penicillium odoratum TaxID=1167516 RepID=UPI002549B25C|nr:uncharacterized protein N7520_005224 [Penicillium odoratum]KAJ5765665.1 hypothetical protein N7520_005224 [Penicillium odoratum]
MPFALAVQLLCGIWESDYNSTKSNEANTLEAQSGFDVCLPRSLCTSSPLQSPTSVHKESQWSKEGLMFHGKEVKLTGRPDYTVWYGDDDDLAVNIVMMEVKATDLALTGVPQALGHGSSERKKCSKADCQVYGLAGDDKTFSCLKINNQSPKAFGWP